MAGGAIEMKPSISGRRIRSCMPIQAPNEKPAIQQLRGVGLSVCSQSSAEAASDNSPIAVIEAALAAADAAEIEAQRREAALHEGV